MDVSRFFSKLRKQVGFHSSDQNLSSDDEMLQCDESDQEIDGFLIVGNSEGGDQTRGPDGLPSYKDAVHDDFLQQPDAQLSPDSFADSVAIHADQPGAFPQTPVSDVPLDFHPSLRTHHYIDSMFRNIDLEIKSFNWTKYSYDFTNEELYLRDVNFNDATSPR